MMRVKSIRLWLIRCGRASPQIAVSIASQHTIAGHRIPLRAPVSRESGKPQKLIRFALQLVVSPVHEIEIDAIDDPIEREHLLSMLAEIGSRVPFDLHRVRQRAERLSKEGLGPADAVHLAFSEAAAARFITCDDRLVRQCRRVQPDVWCGTPVAFCSEENL